MIGADAFHDEIVHSGNDDRVAERISVLVVTAGLITSSSFEQLPNHLRLAKTNGLTEAEIKEAIIYLAFYAGWPKAMSGIQVAKHIFAE